MPNIGRNSFTSIYPVTGAIRGQVTFTGGVPAVGSLSGSNALDRAQVSATDTATGRVAIVITDFRGPQGVCLGVGTAIQGGCAVATSTGSYSGNTATVNFAVTNQATSLADIDFTFEIWAY